MAPPGSVGFLMPFTKSNIRFEDKILLLIKSDNFLSLQKQRPNVERVAACIRQHHPQYSNETVFQVRKCYQCNVNVAAM